MEQALSTWIHECSNESIPLDINIIKQEALKIYNHLRNIGESAISPDFVASKGWYDRFKKRFLLQNLKIPLESSEVDKDARKHPKEWQEIMMRGYSTNQKNETTSVHHDVSTHLESELTATDSTDPEMSIKDEPMSGPEAEDETSGIKDIYPLLTPLESSPRPEVSTSLVPSVISVCTLSKPPAAMSSGDILNVPMSDFPMRPGLPSSQIVLKDHSGAAANSVMDTNPSQPSSSSMNESEEDNKIVPPHRTRDQYDVYGEYIASKLRSMDWKTRAYVQKGFGDIIFEAEMGKYSQIN